MKPRYNINRRGFLRGLSATALAGASMGGWGTALTGLQQAQAADTSGYKAVVCLFLFGGMDNHDTILPYDQASYDQQAGIRSSLFADYAGDRARANLLPLNPSNAADFGGREFALPQQLSFLHQQFTAGNAAVIGNVGPLIEPITRDTFDETGNNVPPRLFSHNDQQSTWMAGSPEGAQFGWGGRIADTVLRSDASTTPEFAAITTGFTDLFLTGDITSAYQLTGGDGGELEVLRRLEAFTGSSNGQVAFDLAEAHLRAAQYRDSSLIGQDIADKMASSLDNNALFRAATEGDPLFTTEFPATFLGQQLRNITGVIAARGTLRVARQVFFAAQGGYDTHASQAVDLVNLHTELDEALAAFYAALDELGLADAVTLFTASDFGRTLAINGDGTDHGWGGHHFVIGNAVNGGAIYGDIPPPTFGHALDAGGGRLIPSMSIEQFATPMARWFGLNTDEINGVFPNLGNFPGGTPGYI